MATIERSAYGTLTTALSTELNSLADAATSAASAQIDNSTDHAVYHDLELAVTFGSAPTDNRTCEVYLLPSVDGTTYADGGGAVTPRPNRLVGVFMVRSVTSAQRHALERIEVPPGLFKYALRNMTGVAFPASGSTLKYRSHELSSV